MANGIEAYIGLNEEHMAKLENEKEFLKVVSLFRWCHAPNPGVVTEVSFYKLFYLVQF